MVRAGGRPGDDRRPDAERALIARLYGAVELTQLIRLAALKLVFVGLASVPLALLNRGLRFREVGAVMAGATLLSSTLTITLASTGAGAAAPLVGSTAHGLFQFLGTCVFGFYRPRARFSWSHVAPMARDGVQLAGAVSINQLTRNIDYLVLGKVVGLNLLGTYRVAFDLAMAPSFAVMQVVNRASLPIYARISGEGGALSPAFARTLRLVALLLIPPLLVAAIDGEILFDLLDKAHAGDIGVTVAALCVAAWLRGLSQCTLVAFMSSGHPTRALLQTASSASLLVVALVVGLGVWSRRDPLLIAACAWIASSALQLAVDYALSRAAVVLRPMEWMKAVGVPLAVAVLTAIVALTLHRVLDADVPAVALALDAVAIVTVYGLLLRYGLGVRGLRELRPKRDQS